MWTDTKMTSRNPPTRAASRSLVTAGGREQGPWSREDAGPDLSFPQGLGNGSDLLVPGAHDPCAFIQSVQLTTCSNANLVVAGKAACPAAWPLLRAAAGGVRGCHRKPVFPSKHSHHRDRQHHPAWWQRAGAPELRHGLHPDRRHHQREPWRPLTRVGAGSESQAQELGRSQCPRCYPGSSL